MAKTNKDTVYSYNIPDAEHEGDVNYEKTRLINLGATIKYTDIKWDDEEIVEATIYFTASKTAISKIKKVMDIY